MLALIAAERSRLYNDNSINNYYYSYGCEQIFSRCLHNKSGPCPKPSAVHAALFMLKSRAESLSNVDNLRGYAS